MDGFGNLAVYQTVRHQEHFRLSSKGTVSVKRVSFDKYELITAPNGMDILHFSERYNPYWKIKDMNGRIISGKESEFQLSEYPVNGAVNQRYILYFEQENIYMIGRVVTIVSLLFSIAVILLMNKNDTVFNRYFHR